MRNIEALTEKQSAIIEELERLGINDKPFIIFGNELNCFLDWIEEQLLNGNITQDSILMSSSMRDIIPAYKKLRSKNGHTYSHN